MRLEQSLYGEIIQKNTIKNRYICNIDFINFPTIGGGSLGKSLGTANYIKIFPNGDELSVHAPNGIISGAKINRKKVSNYEACMKDLLDGDVKENTGGEW